MYILWDIKHINQYSIKSKGKQKNYAIIAFQGNVKMTWEKVGIYLQTGKTYEKTTCVELLLINKVQINNPKELAEQFCKFFAHVGKNIRFDW